MIVNDDRPRHLAAAMLALAAAALLLVRPQVAAAQEAAGEPPRYRQAMDHLEAGDTAAAMVRLREVVRDQPRYGPAFLRLGSLLSARASEVETEFGDRSEAEDMLERAFRLMGAEPEVLLEYGLLLRKKQSRVDAKRILDRAWEAAEEKGASFSAAQRARLHYELGRIYEAWWEDWQGLIQIPETAEGIRCSRAEAPLPHGQLAVLCPERWAEQLEGVVPLADLKSDEHRRMIAHFRLALEADPAHVDAATRLLGHLADAELWREYEETARHLLRYAPTDPRAHLFLGLGLHERGRDGEADRAFARALELLPPAERRVFNDVEPLLRREDRAAYRAADSVARVRVQRVVFTGKDPLFLTPANERRLEHYARLAWAELKFAAPASGLRGWESDRGRIWVRYGAPWRSYQCCYGAAYGGQSGRTVYWSYGVEGPLFTFERSLTYRRARFTDPAATLADELEATAPEAYRPRAVTAVHPLPHQVARFRGSGPELTRVEIYAAPPVDSLFAAPGSRVETGIFTFLPDYTPIWERRALADVRESGVSLTYRFELAPGTYRYALEARLMGPDSLPRPAARERASVQAQGFPPGRLALSDLLLAADTVRPRTPSPVAREELVVAPLRGTDVRAGEPIHLYLEVYGLTPDSGGIGHYRAELAVEDSTSRNVAERLLRAGREVLGRGAPDARVGWERQARVVDDVVPEYLSVEVPRLDPGEYVVRVRVVDARTGEEAERVRRVRVLPDG